MSSANYKYNRSSNPNVNFQQKLQFFFSKNPGILWLHCFEQFLRSIFNFAFYKPQAAEKFKEPEPVNTAISDSKVEAAGAEESDDDEEVSICC